MFRKSPENVKKPGNAPGNVKKRRAARLHAMFRKSPIFAKKPYFIPMKCSAKT